MKTLRISAVEMQDIISTFLRARLAQAGFRMLNGEGEEPSIVMLPVNIGIDGPSTIVQQDDGTWVFSQWGDQIIADRTMQAHMDQFEMVRANAIKLAADQ